MPPFSLIRPVADASGALLAGDHVELDEFFSTPKSQPPSQNSCGLTRLPFLFIPDLRAYSFRELHGVLGNRGAAGGAQLMGHFW